MSQQINLFSPIFLRQKKHFSAVPMIQGLAMVIVAMLVFYVYATRQVSVLAMQSAELAKRTEAIQSKFEKSGSGMFSAKKTSNMPEQIKLAEADLKQRRDLINGLGGGPVGNTEGYSIFMKSLARQNINGLWLTGFSVSDSGNDMRISGRALHAELIPVFIRKLNQEAFLRGRSFEYLQIRSSQAGAAATVAQTPAPAVSAPTSPLAMLAKLLNEQSSPDKQAEQLLGTKQLDDLSKPKEAAQPQIKRAYVEFDLSTRALEDAGKPR